MILSSINLVQLNPFNTELNSIKEYTIVSTRPDLKITERLTVPWFTPSELDNQHHWNQEQFDYDISELGFRDIDLPDSFDIGAFGCSFTFGQGLPLDSLWHRCLSKHINASVYNFGQPAASIQTIADIFLIVLQHIKFKRVIILSPPYHRQLVASKHLRIDEIKLLPIIPSYISYLEKRFELDSEKIYNSLSEEEMIRIYKDKLYLIEYICKQNDIDMFLSSWDDSTYNLIKQMNLTHCRLLPVWTSGIVPDYQNDLARDKMHPGIKHHALWAKIIKEYVE